MLVHDSQAHPQAEPGASGFLRGKEWLEDPRHVLPRDASAGISHGDSDSGVSVASGCPAHANRNCPCSGQRLQSIQNQIGKDLAQFAREGPQFFNISKSFLNCDALLIDLAAIDAYYLLQQIRDRSHDWSGEFAIEGERLPSDMDHARQLSLCRVHVLRQLIGQLGMGAQDIEHVGDCGQRVVDFVGNAGCKLSSCSKFLRPAQRLFHHLSGSNVQNNSQHAHGCITDNYGLASCLQPVNALVRKGHAILGFVLAMFGQRVSNGRVHSPTVLKMNALHPALVAAVKPGRLNAMQAADFVRPNQLSALQVPFPDCDADTSLCQLHALFAAMQGFLCAPGLGNLFLRFAIETHVIDRN